MSDNTIFGVALNKAMTLCSRQELCSEDVRNKLLIWGVVKDDIEKIISILIKENFISESRYATAFVRDKFNYNKWGKIKIAAHLRAKKLSPDIIRNALGLIDNEQYTKILRGLINDHRRSVKAKNQYDLKAKLLRYGLSKGFESSLLYDMLNESGE
jgi:regulatory protein